MGERELEHVSTPATRLLVGCMAISYSAEELEHIADELRDAAAAKRKGEPVATSGVCRVCGCTDEEGCEGPVFGCWWVEPDLCSQCADPAYRDQGPNAYSALDGDIDR